MEKPLAEFNKDKGGRHGVTGSCKRCRKAAHTKWKEQNPTYYKDWRLVNKDTQREAIYRWREANLDYHQSYNKDYNFQTRKQRATTRKVRYHNDINYRLTRVLRARLNGALRNNHKSGSAVEDLGCSIEEFRIYLESKFQEGMSWANYGKWHIDHILPLSSFDLADREQLLKACHYTNLQPLWLTDNLKKSDKLPV